MPITVSAPTRIDLAGGTLDIWPICRLLRHPSTVNIAWNLRARCLVEPAAGNHWELASTDRQASWHGTWRDIPETGPLGLAGLTCRALSRSDAHPRRVVCSCEAPAGSGLGGSSALAVALAAALGAGRDAGKLLDLARDLEATLIQIPTGVQDYLAAIQGGLNHWNFDPGATRQVRASEDTATRVAARLMLFNSGESRASAINNWEVFRRVFDGDSAMRRQLQAIADCATRCGTALVAGDIEALFAASREEWQLRRELWPSIETAATREIDRLACSRGALFTRVCGAGGGGMVAIVLGPNVAQSEIRRVFSSTQYHEAVGGYATDGLDVRET